MDKLGSQTPVVVGNVPIGVAFFGHYTSKVGDVMTRFFETTFQVIPATNAQLPSELAYQKNGVMFGNRLIQASRRANIADPQLRTDLIAYVYNCTLYDLQDGTIDPAGFSQSIDIWSLMGTPNPARFATYGNPVQVDTCPNVYTYLANRLPAEVARARAMLAFQLNPSLDATAAQGVIDSQIEQAYYKTKIATAAQGASDLLRQNIMINLVQDTSSIVGQKINDPASVMIATARANATASINSSFLTMGKVAEQALPLIRNVIEAIIYAVFPFVFLLFLLDTPIVARGATVFHRTSWAGRRPVAGQCLPILHTRHPVDCALPGWTLIFIVLGNIAKVLLVKQALGFITRSLGLGNQGRNDNVLTVDNLFAFEVAAIGNDS